MKAKDKHMHNQSYLVQRTSPSREFCDVARQAPSNAVGSSDDNIVRDSDCQSVVLKVKLHGTTGGDIERI